ncbi:MAG: 7-carboxy-7-deazaguanine synthase QueE [Verrucomicrobiales bacterium]|nr:7-carboxy-7-deazaguanine synthase QueE [Verrucomicrobiales bacterium]
MKLARMPDGSPEIFHTLQGEGRNCGLPTVFIRSSLCNLHCVWCDTDYTWNWEGTEYTHEKQGLPGYEKYRKSDVIVTLSEAEIARYLEKYPCQNYVFTGGEPLLQEKSWVKLMEILGRNCHFEIETNGTLTPGEEFLDWIDQLNVSPKLRNSGVDANLRSKPDVLRALQATGKADFKFVVSDEEDLREVVELVDRAGISSERVFLMPKANTVAELESNQGRVAEWARERGYRYSDRLHLRLFGAKRGV